MKVKIHDTTYIFLLISFLSGYFEYMYLFLLIIFVHESGHYFFSKLIRFKYSSITLYPFGGITIYNEDLNISTNKELFVLFGGIVFQLLFYLLIVVLFNNGCITSHVFNIIKRINIILISFNFMPIIPLDGGKLMNILLDKVLSYKISNMVSIIVSILFSLYFVLFHTSLFKILLFIYLIKCIYFELCNSNLKYNRFILERYLNNYKFKRIKIIKNINYLRRDFKHIINNQFENDYLHKLFDRKE